MKISFFKKIKEYLFVQHVTDYSFNVGKLGYCSHYKKIRYELHIGFVLELAEVHSGQNQEDIGIFKTVVERHGQGLRVIA